MRFDDLLKRLQASGFETVRIAPREEAKPIAAGIRPVRVASRPRPVRLWDRVTNWLHRRTGVAQRGVLPMDGDTTGDGEGGRPQATENTWVSLVYFDRLN